jgi:hypothetical protein
MNKIETVDFLSLVGEHWLSGCDEETLSFETGYSWRPVEDANCINFILDGKTYTAKEDPNDGYRSMMDDLFVSDYQVKNTFHPVKVVVSHVTDNSDKWSHIECDILRFTDCVNGKVVLEVGTDNTDDYYPSFVASFSPENMSINEGRK